MWDHLKQLPVNARRYELIFTFDSQIRVIADH